MSKEVKVALIGAAATILAAIITGIFLLRSQPNNVATSTTSASAGSITQTIPQSAVTPSANTNASTPEATLITFCNAMKKGDYATAYDQFSSQTKSLVSEQSFISGNLSISQSKDGITDCTFSNVQINGSSATALLTYTYGDGETGPTNLTLMIENGVWKIEGAS